jgi:hypothetical protein
MGLCENEWVMVTGGLLWQWTGGHLLGCGGGGGLGVRAALEFGALRGIPTFI